MIHEEQLRQLCAIHTVNNLLQLPSDLDYDSYSEGERDRYQQREGECAQKRTHAHEWTCRGRVLCRFERSPTSCGEAESESDDGAQQGFGGDNKETKEKRSIGRWRAATQVEFDDIAAEFTIREQRLISGDANASSDEEKTSTMHESQEGPDVIKLSLMQRLRSHYWTPYFGN